MFSLYEDQARDVDAIRGLFRTHRCVLYQLPTGGGKTVVAGHIAQLLRAKGSKVLVLVHRRELVRQFMGTLKTAGLADSVGIVCPGFPPVPWAPIQVASIFSWARRQPKFFPDFIFVDEAHHVRAKSWEKVLAWYPNAKVMGMTATPVRLDGKGLNPPFTGLHCGMSIAKLIQSGRLSPFRMLRVPAGFLTGGIKKTGGDYNRKQLDERVNESVVGNSVSAYLRYLKGRRTIMFAVTRRHARITAERLTQEGVRAAYVGDDTKMEVRDTTFERFGEGLLDVVCNVSLVDEGFDVPRCDAIMDVAPTASLTRYMQRNGRGLRYIPGKTAVLMDLAGNVYRHGSPDIDRTWSLEDSEPIGAPSREADKGTSLRCCKACLTVFAPKLSVCPHCGHEHDGRPVREVDVELIEEVGPVKPKKTPRAARMSQQKKGRLLREVRVAVAKGQPDYGWQLLKSAGKDAEYSPAWAHAMADLIGIPRGDRLK